jgi:uncharacterized membrane protein
MKSIQYINQRLFLIMLVLLLSVNILSITMPKVQADDTILVSGPVTFPIDENVVIELDEISISGYSNITVKSQGSVSIRYPKNNIEIRAPRGSVIAGVSNTSVNIEMQTGVHEIKYSDAVSMFSVVNFFSTVDGLDEYHLRIDYDTSVPISSSKMNITRYAIHWGNGEISEGEGALPSQMSYRYNDQGEYPVSIELTDEDGFTFAFKSNHTFQLSTSQYISFWVVENRNPLALVFIGTFSGFSLYGVAFTENGKYRFLALLGVLIPMQVRLQKEDILDQFVRGKIYGFIKGNPGVHYNQIMRELDMKNGTLSYHLYMLEKTGMIKSRTEGVRYRAFYPSDMRFPEHERYRLTELQLSIMQIIREHNGVNQKYISKKLQERHQTISYNIKVLQQAGLINVNKKGRTTWCYVNHDHPSANV